MVGFGDVGVAQRPGADLEVIAYGRYRNSLLYVDPPYLGNIRERNYYHEMGSEAAHRGLVEALHTCRATVVISGYGNPLYDEELYRAWHRYTLEVSTSPLRSA